VPGAKEKYENICSARDLRFQVENNNNYCSFFSIEKKNNEILRSPSAAENDDDDDDDDDNVVIVREVDLPPGQQCRREMTVKLRCLPV